jgi:hypothetical protein
MLAPGASANRDHTGLVAIDQAATVAGFTVRRIDFPYRLAGRRAPDRPAVLVSTVVREAGSLAAEGGIAPEEIFLGGRSMGGRICSMAVAGGMPAAGLVLVSYPLHPPGRPDRLRTEHFRSLNLPCLFVSGTSDAFAAPAELEAALVAVPGKVTVRWLEGGDHGLRGREDEAAAIVAAWLASQLHGPVQ